MLCPFKLFTDIFVVVFMAAMHDHGATALYTYYMVECKIIISHTYGCPTTIIKKHKASLNEATCLTYPE